MRKRNAEALRRIEQTDRRNLVHKAVFAVAVSVLFGSGGAAPSASPSNSKSQNIKSLEHMAASGEVIKLADVVRFLEDEGKLEWTQTRNGSRMTSIPQSYYNGTLTQMRKGTHSRLRKRGWGDWSSAGTIAGLAAQYSCYDSGDTGLMGQARGYVNQACDDLTQASAQGRLVNGAWQIWQSAQTSDADGNPSIDLFGVMPWGSNPPQYQSSMCTRYDHERTVKQEDTND